jgi:hypothetical protein
LLPKRKITGETELELSTLQLQLDRLLDLAGNAGLDKATMEELASLICGMVRTLYDNQDYIGVGPYNTEPGDFCAVLFGGDVPFVLRDEGDEQMLVGDCYVHGIMQGEVVADTETVDMSCLKDGL